MLKILVTILAEFWKPIALFFSHIGTFIAGRRSKAKDDKVKKLEAELEAVERLKNVKTNTDRDAALQRLRRSGNVRED